MGDERVLSSEEVEALLQATKSSSDDMHSDNAEGNTAFNRKEFANILEAFKNDVSKVLTALLRKKISVKIKLAQQTEVKDFVESQKDAKLASTYCIEPYKSDVLTCIDYNLIYQTTNLLYGGKLEQNPTEAPYPGKVGTVVGKKISSILMDSLKAGCAEHTAISPTYLKTSTSLTRINNLLDNEKVQVLELTIFLEDNEYPVFLAIPEEMLIKLLPINTNTAKHREKDFWRDAIKSEVMDSMVTVSVTLKDIQTPLEDINQMSNGFEIPIEDPTSVYVCLNNYKLFHAVAGESNGKLVAKVIKQI